MPENAAARASLLQDLTFELGRASNAHAAAAAVVRLGRALLAGVSSVLWLVEPDGALALVATDGVPDSFVAEWARVPANTPQFPALNAVRAGQPLWVASPEEYRDVDHRIAERARQADRPMAFTALPLVIEARTLGVIVFGFRAPHPFAEDEKKLALAIAGHAAQALDRARLQAESARALAGLRVLAKVGEMIAASLDVDETLTALARAVVPDIADWCAVDLLSASNVRRLTAHHSDPRKVELAKSYAERFPERLDDPASSIARIAESGQPIWVRRITPEMLQSAVADPEKLAILQSLGLRSSVQTPLVSEGRIRGVVTFIMSESGREYDEGDRELLVEVGRRAGLAITNAELYAREKRARDRVTRIAAVTAALARAPTTADVGEVACREGTVALGADTSVLYALEGGVLRLLASYDVPHVDRWRELPLPLNLPITAAVTGNDSVVLETRAQLLAFADMESRGPLFGAGAVMCKPLRDRNDRVVGALGFGFKNERTFLEDERALARTLADHCAQAFDRALILDLERRARERVALLAAAGETFSASIDYEETLQAVVRIALPTLGDFAFFDIVEESGQVRRTSRAHDDPEVAAILAASQWVRSERTDINLCALSSGRPALHSAIDEAFLADMATNEQHLAVLRALRLCSMITVPVSIRGRVIGALTLCHGRSGRHHSAEDLALAAELARRGAIAVEQARLYRASQEAARRAEEANRVKDDFLATVSHELRTPLNAIVGWAHLLDGDGLQDVAFARRGLDVIRRNAQAQRELIDDILDVSRIITGKMRIDPAPMDLAEVARDALDVIRPAADAKGVRLDTSGIAQRTPIVGDAARLRQVVWNLVANSVKFTSRGGTVRIEARSQAETVVLRVDDDGAGISPDLMPYVFDRFRQADSSSTRNHGGLGLGLSIVRHLVELHGGAVTARSDGPGRGATFEVVLPTAAPPSPAYAGEQPRTPLPSADAHVDVSGLRVLVVDDDPDSRDLFALVLRGGGAEVHVASNAREGSTIFERRAIDVVVSDIAMPDVDGYAFITMLREAARERGQAVKAIALTAYGRAADRAATERAGFAAHLAKPVTPASLLEAVRRVGRQSGVISTLSK